MLERNYANPIKNCEKILDVGCGSGKFMHRNWTGLDINPKFANGNIKTGSVTKMPFKSNRFDGIFACNIMEHLTYKDSIKFFLEAYRVLEPGGLFLVITSPLTSSGFYDNPEHIRPWPINAFRQLLSDNEIKFTIVNYNYFAGVFPFSAYILPDFLWDFLANKIRFHRNAIRVLMKKR